jgi:small subunit ribosomal protein S21
MSKKNTHVNVRVTPKKNENFEKTLKRFMKKVKKERIIEQVKERKHFEKPSVIKRRAKLEAIKRDKKRVREFEKKANSQTDNIYKKRG